MRGLERELMAGRGRGGEVSGAAGQRGGMPGCHGVSGGDSGNRPGDKAETGVQRAWLLPHK